MCSKRGIGRSGRGVAAIAPLCRRVAAAGSRSAGLRAAVAAVVVALAGSPGAFAQPPAAAPAGKAQPSATAKATIVAVDHAGLMAAVARHKGKVVVLDCWSTSCPPCVKEFPRLVALQAKHGDRVVCMSLSLDYEGLDPVDTLVPPVLRFLQDVKAGGVINLIATEEADAMYKKLELDSVPAVYVWKADGSLARRFDEGDAKARLGRPFTYDDVEAEVQGLLAE